LYFSWGRKWAELIARERELFKEALNASADVTKGMQRFFFLNFVTQMKRNFFGKEKKHPHAKIFHLFQGRKRKRWERHGCYIRRE